DQIMYGIAGERRLFEWEVSWLPGYEQSKPVRVGNAAATQLQLDVYGEVADAMHQARKSGMGSRNRVPPSNETGSNISNGSGWSPTRGSGRFAEGDSSSRTPKSWRGWPWIAQSRILSVSTSPAPSIIGVRCATGSMHKCVSKDST